MSKSMKILIKVVLVILFILAVPMGWVAKMTYDIKRKGEGFCDSVIQGQSLDVVLQNAKKLQMNRMWVARDNQIIAAFRGRDLPENSAKVTISKGTMHFYSTGMLPYVCSCQVWFEKKLVTRKQGMCVG